MKRITVGQIHNKHGAAFKPVRESTPLDTVIGTFAAGASVQSVFVVDESGFYKGAVTRKDLLRWLAVKVVGGESSRSLSVGNMRQILFAADVNDLVSGGARVPSISESTNLEQALRVMMDSDEPVLPVVDGEGKLVGDLRVSEILNAALNFDDDSQEVIYSRHKGS